MSIQSVQRRNAVKPKLYWISRGGSGAFGDCLLASYLVSILHRNGVPAVFGNKRLYKLVDCPLAHPSHLESNDVVFHRIDYLFNPRDGKSFIRQLIDNFRTRTGERCPIKNIPNYIPVKYADLPYISGVDVSLNSVCGPFSPYKQWPYFPELKNLLRQAGITYVDMAEKKVWNNEYLNYVNKSKLYVGLDTGASHYVSQVANGKALILQSGYNLPQLWCNYDYQFLRYHVPCSPCYKTRHSIAAGQGCPFEHECMRKLTPEIVFSKIATWLSSEKSNRDYAALSATIPQNLHQP